MSGPAGPAIFVTTSPLHVLYSLAIVRTLGIASHEIHWFGKAPLERLALSAHLREEDAVRDFTHLDLNSFGGFLRDADAYLAETAAIGRPSRLFTSYETHYPFVALRHDRRVAWADVGIIEDGSANYFPHAMPRRHKQPPKSLATLLRRGHPLPFSWNNLGGNRRIGTVTTLSPEHVYVAPRSRARVVDIAPAVRDVLRERGSEPPAALRDADVVIFLPAVFNYGRLDAAGLRDYLARLKAHPAFAGATRWVVKPHPREDMAALDAALAGEAVSIGGDLPVELWTERLDNPFWVGSPSTGMLNKHLLYPESRTRYVLFPIPGNPLLPSLIETFRRILGGSVDVVTG